MRVTVIRVFETHDHLLCLEKKLIVAADGDMAGSVWMIQEAARNLAEHFGVEIEDKVCSLAGLPEGWSYADIVAQAFLEVSA